jgi:hypothetical protein
MPNPHIGSVLPIAGAAVVKLLADLRELFDQTDPVPDQVTTAAKEAFEERKP